ncbi:MAG: TRAP transporter large permease subunit [Chloroflexota bacterium]|nr:TRAP transporter large permease subunit [Chloroflexota bacterium]
MITLLAAVFGGLILLLISGLWIAVATGGIGITLYFINSGWSALTPISHIVWTSAENFPIATVPLFIFLGYMLMESGLAGRVYAGLEPLLNHIPGGLLHTNIVVGALFAACSGSGMASAAAIGTVALPEMEKRGYPRSLSIGSVAAGGVLAPIIPPSIMMIMYCVITGQSIGKAFIAGIFPGLGLAVLFSLYIAVVFQFYQDWAKTRGPLVPLKKSISASKEVWPIVILIFLVLGTIYLGIATPTESAAVGSVGAIVLAALHRGLNWQSLKKTTVATVTLTSVVLIIYIGTHIMSSALAMSGAIGFITQGLTSLAVPRVGVLLIVYLIFIILGLFIDTLPMMLMTVPLVFPTIVALGYDPLWFGIAVVLLTNTGNLTPPVGMILFVMQSLNRGRPVSEVYKGVIPFAVLCVVMLGIVTAFPQIALWLPTQMLGK